MQPTLNGDRLITPSLPGPEVSALIWQGLDGTIDSQAEVAKSLVVAPSNFPEGLTNHLYQLGDHALQHWDPFPTPRKTRSQNPLLKSLDTEEIALPNLSHKAQFCRETGLMELGLLTDRTIVELERVSHLLSTKNYREVFDESEIEIVSLANPNLPGIIIPGGALSFKKIRPEIYTLDPFKDSPVAAVGRSLFMKMSSIVINWTIASVLFGHYGVPKTHATILDLAVSVEHFWYASRSKTLGNLRALANEHADPKSPLASKPFQEIWDYAGQENNPVKVAKSWILALEERARKKAARNIEPLKTSTLPAPPEPTPEEKQAAKRSAVALALEHLYPEVKPAERKNQSRLLVKAADSANVTIPALLIRLATEDPGRLISEFRSASKLPAKKEIEKPTNTDREFALFWSKHLKPNSSYEVEMFKDEDGTSVAEEIAALDNTARLKVTERIQRFELGNFGDKKRIKGGGVFESRVHTMGGIRIYWCIDYISLNITVLRVGDKSDQTDDCNESQARYLRKKSQG